MAKKSKTLSRYNNITSTFNIGLIFQSPVPNGIACPKCGKELLDTQPNVTLTSMPLKKNIGCSNENCDYVGYRIIF